MAVVRPFSELDLAHELRLHPHDIPLPHLRHLRLDGERKPVVSQRLELREQPGDVGLPEAGAAVAGPLQLPFALRPEHHRAAAAAPATLALPPAADPALPA